MSCSSRCAGPEIARRTALALLATASWAVASDAPPAEVLTALPGARLQGRGRLRYFGLHVYDALLWSAQPIAPDEVPATLLALELRYARALRGPLIAERSISEMKRAGGFGEAEGQRWLEAMKGIFPDVNDGDRITGVQRPGEGALFFVNAQPAGAIRDAAFARLFFGIWLSPRTSEPALRAALLGTG